MPSKAATGRSAASRRLGYLIAIIVNGALLFLINDSPGWRSAAFLTSSTTQVIGVVNLALAVSLAANVAYLAHDARWLRALGDLATTSVGLAAALAIWQVFPFAFHGSASGWSVVVRVLVMIGIVGSCIAIVVNLVLLARAAGGAGRPSPRH
ncbi:MAG TPA: hypothetical protein VMU94_27810 [Streptosporangiaceae bacterium]|nr:hypothetical protein [Streptosporangiaceae bacterium]